HFAEAALLDPLFVDAHAYAGLAYAQAHEAARALPYYQEAVRLEPSSGALVSNLAGVLINLNRPAEAEPAARRAVQLAPASVEAHYMLGVALLGMGKATPETAAHLKIAAEKYSLARAMLAAIQERDPSSASPGAVH